MDSRFLNRICRIKPQQVRLTNSPNLNAREQRGQTRAASAFYGSRGPFQAGPQAIEWRHLGNQAIMLKSADHNAGMNAHDLGTSHLRVSAVNSRRDAPSYRLGTSNPAALASARWR